MHRTEVFDLIKEFAGQSNILTVPVAFIRYTGTLEAALLLSQILYWSDKKEGGWFYKTHKEWEEELALSKYEARKATKLLIDKGILETRVKKVNGTPTLHYHLKEAEFSLSIVQFLNNRKLTDCTFMESEKSELSINNRLPKTTNKRADSDSEPKPPFCGPEFNQALAEFMAHHREIGKPYKPTGLKGLYRKLEAWGEAAATQALRESVSNRWQGVFPPKGNGTGSLPPEHPNAYRPGKMVL